MYPRIPVLASAEAAEIPAAEPLPRAKACEEPHQIGPNRTENKRNVHDVEEREEESIEPLVHRSVSASDHYPLSINVAFV